VNIENKLIQSNINTTTMFSEFEDRINKMYTQFQEEILQSDLKIQEIQDLSYHCNTVSSENNSLIEVVKSMMVKVQESLDQNVCELNKLKTNKVSVEDHEATDLEIGSRFRILDFNNKTLQNLLTANDEYLNNVLPF